SFSSRLPATVRAIADRARPRLSRREAGDADSAEASAFIGTVLITNIRRRGFLPLCVKEALPPAAETRTSDAKPVPANPGGTDEITGRVDPDVGGASGCLARDRTGPRGEPSVGRRRSPCELRQVEVLADEADDHRALADGGRDAVHGPGADVAGREHARRAGL